MRPWGMASSSFSFSPFRAMCFPFRIIFHDFLLSHFEDSAAGAGRRGGGTGVGRGQVGRSSGADGWDRCGGCRRVWVSVDERGGGGGIWDQWLAQYILPRSIAKGGSSIPNRKQEADFWILYFPKII